MTTGKRISNLRELRNVLQKDLAKAIHVDPVVLNRIEKGKRSARDEEIKAIADYFDVSADYLLGRENSKTSALSDDETTMLSVFDTLSAEGKKLLMAILSSLGVTHSRNKPKLSNVVQQNRSGNNYGVVGGNFSSNVTIG